MNKQIVNEEGVVIGELAEQGTVPNNGTKTAVKAFVGGIIVGALALTAYSLLTGKLEIYPLDEDSVIEEG